MHLRTFSFLRDLAGDEQIALRIRGGCMRPLIEHDSSVTVRRRRLYLPGDVIVHRNRANDLLVHRVLGYRLYRGQPALVTKGDRCVLHDAPTLRESVVGAVENLPISLASRLEALGRFARILLRRLTL